MTDQTDDASAERSDDPRTDVRGDGELPEIACTLTEDEVERRREWIQADLVPHLKRIEERDDGFSFVFDRTPAAYEAVTTLAWNESRCCSWATFEVELPPGDGPIRWNACSDRTEGPEFFGEALQETLRELEDVPTPG